LKLKKVIIYKNKFLIAGSYTLIDKKPIIQIYNLIVNYIIKKEKLIILINLIVNIKNNIIIKF